MIALLLTGALALMLGGCAGNNVYEFAVGANVTEYMPWSEGQQGGFAGGVDTVRASVRRESNDGKRFCQFSHHSHISTGAPFNDRYEDWFDNVECGLAFGRKSR